MKLEFLALKEKAVLLSRQTILNAMRLSDAEIEQLPDFQGFAYEQIIEWVLSEREPRNVKEVIVKELKMLQYIGQRQFDLESNRLKIQDDVIMQMPEQVLETTLSRMSKSQVRQLFNPISEQSKTKLNAAFSRKHRG